jgi:hypothetical protein
VITKGFILAKENTLIRTKILRDHAPVSNIESDSQITARSGVG